MCWRGGIVREGQSDWGRGGGNSVSRGTVAWGRGRRGEAKIVRCSEALQDRGSVTPAATYFRLTVFRQLSMHQVRHAIAFQDWQCSFDVCPVDVAEARYACTTSSTGTFWYGCKNEVVTATRTTSDMH